MIVDKKQFGLRIEYVYFAEKIISTKSDIIRYYQASFEYPGAEIFTSPVIDLDESLHAIYANFRSSTRNEIKDIMLNHNFKCQHHLSPTDIDISNFQNFYNQFAIKKGLPLCDVNQLNRLRKHIALSYVQLSSDLDVCHVYLYDSSRIRLLYSCTRSVADKKDASLRLKANKLLHFKDIEWAKELGLKVYDFGGISIGDPSLDGVNKFKLGFSKKIEKTFNLILPNSIMGRIALAARSALK